MTFSGSDPNQLDSAAAQVALTATSLSTTARKLRSEVHNSPWSGQAADQFRGDFDQYHHKNLMMTSRYLHEVSKSLIWSASSQRDVSQAKAIGRFVGLYVAPILFLGPTGIIVPVIVRAKPAVESLLGAAVAFNTKVQDLFFKPPWETMTKYQNK
jgi:uncharacterized protein YukE